MTKANDKKLKSELEQLQNRFLALNTIAGRVLPSFLRSQLGQDTFNGARDLYAAFGYPHAITPEMYSGRKSRQAMAFAVCERPVNASWRGGFDLGTEEAEDTQFQKDFWRLYKQFKINLQLRQLDKYAGEGGYSVLFFGLDDVQGDNHNGMPVKEGKRKLLYLKCFKEKNAPILNLDTNPKSARFGMPLMYELRNIGKDGKQELSYSVNVHYSRVLHVATDTMNDEVYGTPRLEAIYNDLINIEKVGGGASEMYWRGARPGFTATADKEFTLTADFVDGLKNQFDEYENNLRRFLAVEGAAISPLTQQIEDPTSNVDAAISMIAAATGIPKRILVGSERGELASSQDQATWVDLLESRRSEFMEPCIIHPFIEKLLDFGIIAEPVTEHWTIEWKPLSTPSEKEQAEVAQIRTSTITQYADSFNASSVIPRKTFFTDILGLSDEKYNEMVDLGAEELMDIDEPESDITEQSNEEPTESEADNEPV